MAMFKKLTISSADINRLKPEFIMIIPTQNKAVHIAAMFSENGSKVTDPAEVAASSAQDVAHFIEMACGYVSQKREMNYGTLRLLIRPDYPIEKAQRLAEAVIRRVNQVASVIFFAEGISNVFTQIFGQPDGANQPGTPDTVSPNGETGVQGTDDNASGKLRYLGKTYLN